MAGEKKKQTENKAASTPSAKEASRRTTSKTGSTRETPAQKQKSPQKAKPEKAAASPRKAQSAREAPAQKSNPQQKAKPEKAAASPKAARSARETSSRKQASQQNSNGKTVDWHDFTKKMEQSLLVLKSEIIDNLIVNNKDFKEIVEGMDPKDFADIASDDIDRKMIEAIGSQELRRLRLIDSALTRIKQGKYGYCIKCSTRIPSDRLEAIPYALMCIECKAEDERRNR